MVKSPQFSITQFLIVVAIAACVLAVVYNAVLRTQYRDISIHREFLPEVQQMHERYINGKVLFYREIDLLGKTHFVAIVETVRGAEYGFLATPETLNDFYLRKAGVTIKKYDDFSVFVTIADRTASTYPKHSRVPDSRTQ